MLSYFLRGASDGAVVRSLILKGFRSVRAGQIVFDNPTFLVGRNGSGKSNIADAFAFLAEAMNLSLNEALDRRGGISNLLHKTVDKESPATLGIAVEFDHEELIRSVVGNFENWPAEARAHNIVNARYALELKVLPNYRFEIDREQCVLTRANGNKVWFDRRKQNVKSNADIKDGHFRDEGQLALPVVGSFTDGFFNIAKILRTMRVYSIEPSRLREMQDPDSGASLKRDGANAASVLEDIKRRMPRDIPRMEQFLSVIVPEEPESSVHPAAAGAVLDLLLMLQKKCRLLLAPIARKYSTLNGLKIDICAS